MDFAFSAEENELRASIRAFIKEHLSDEIKRDLQETVVGQGYTEASRRFLGMIRDCGWSGVSWPKKYGGHERSRIAQFIVEEEFHRAAGLGVGGGGTGAPAILAAGTQAQKDAFIPGSISMDIVFCQGYSEPHCGTDLAGIRCRATRQGDKFVVNGQKIYTTNAQNSTHIFLLVRTAPESRRHAGLSILLVPMNLPGITVRPLWTVQHEPRAPSVTTYAEPRTNEVFFDDVEVPADALLGEENDGWRVAQRGLNLDRVGARRYLISIMRDEDVVNYLKSGDEFAEEKRTDPRVRDKVAQLWTEAQVCRLMTMRSLSIEEGGGNFVYEGSAEKVFAPEHGVASTEAISQILGPRAQLLNGSPEALNEGVFAHNLLGAFQSTVNHGSVQVMRDQVARKGLGMPRQKS